MLKQKDLWTIRNGNQRNKISTLNIINLQEFDYNHL
jgi:hypothetical protein